MTASIISAGPEPAQTIGHRAHKPLGTNHWAQDPHGQLPVLKQGTPAPAQTAQ